MVKATRVKHILLVSGTCLLALPTLSFGDESEDIIKYRQAVMKAVGGHMSATSMIVRGKVSRQAELKNHVASMRELTQDIPGLFPEDSDFGETRAKESVWEKQGEFIKASDKTKQAIDNLLKEIDAGNKDNIAGAFANVGKSCKGCHKDFRQKEE